MNVSIFTHHIRNRACGLCEFEASSGFTSSTPSQAKLVMEDGGVQNATSPTRRQNPVLALLRRSLESRVLQEDETLCGYAAVTPAAGRRVFSNRVKTCLAVRDASRVEMLARYVTPCWTGSIHQPSSIADGSWVGDPVVLAAFPHANADSVAVET
ncbi:uncharacterized protein DFL_004283 [Arthrobotrys flagrans]|uniref:Uncharacterized protein n=1 Tax=Arthrobotrys flagrans TaxID=97331 RepID=A0A437A4E4_ARTFL|nr:hypothetical protein DFL_004283 [Arthrobotrys flagrans]